MLRRHERPPKRLSFAVQQNPVHAPLWHSHWGASSSSHFHAADAALSRRRRRGFAWQQSAASNHNHGLATVHPGSLLTGHGSSDSSQFAVVQDCHLVNTEVLPAVGLRDMALTPSSLKWNCRPRDDATHDKSSRAAGDEAKRLLQLTYIAAQGPTRRRRRSRQRHQLHCRPDTKLQCRSCRRILELVRLQRGPWFSGSWKWQLNDRWSDRRASAQADVDITGNWDQFRFCFNAV